jgi:hypothetical protein
MLLGCSGDDDDDDGSGPDTTLLPSQICSNVAYDTCARLAECASDAQLRSLGYPSSEQCLGDAIEQLGCTSATQIKVCQGAQNSTAADAATCSKQIQAASCGDVSSKPVASYAAACGQCALKPN